MTVESDLLSRICKDPSNREDRLVYADRLMERGDPRGAFIAHQDELATLDVLDPRYPDVLATARRLEAEHAVRWLADLAKRTGLDMSSFQPVFEGGFLRRVALPPDAIAANWSWLQAREPVLGIELLVSEHLPEEHRQLAAAKSFRVLKVSPNGWFTSNSVGDVLSWGMPEVQELDLSRCDLGTTGCRLLANLETDLAESFEGWTPPPPFGKGQLRVLELQGCNVGDVGARILFDAEPLEGIHELGIGQCRLAEKATLIALRDAPRMNALTRLSLAGNNGLVGHLSALEGWDALPRLTRLALPQVITGSELRALLPSASPRLRELDLSSAKELMKTPHVVFEAAEALSHLDVGTTSLGDDGFAELLASPSTKDLIELRANGCSLSDKSVAALVKSKLDRLVTLDLSSNKLTDKALALLAEWRGLERVTQLRLGNNRKVTREGYARLIEASSFVPTLLDAGKQAEESLRVALRERFGKALVAFSR